MTFIYTPNTYTLKFGPNDSLHGLEVNVTSVPLGKFLKLMELASLADGKASEGSASSLQSLFSGFSEALVSWNLTRQDGTAVPASGEVLDSMPTEFGMRLIQEWMQVIAGVSPELGKGSASGVTYPEVQMPMAAA